MGSVAPPLLCPTLIGRESQLDALGSALDAASAGRGRVVLLSGEAGIGKTALLRRFAELARARRARVAIGECLESDAGTPLGPFAGVLDSLERQRLLRAGSTRPEAQIGTIDAAARERLRRSFRVLMAGLTKANALVIAIEDLHWADETSLELFLHLARVLRDERVLLIGTYRGDELPHRHALPPMLAELNRARLSEELVLHRLDSAQTAAFLRETFRGGLDPAPSFRQSIERRCEGNPFFIEEVLKGLHQRGALDYDEGRWSHTQETPVPPIPDSIRGALRSRLDRLPTEALRTLRVAALIGQSFELALLRRVREIDDERLVADVRAAMEAQLVTASDLDPGICVFRHALTRETVLADLLEPERRAFHKSVGTAIEVGSDAAGRAEELAHHFDGAREYGRAHRYHLAAGEAAFGSAAFGRAARHFERAIELAAPSADRGGLHARLAEALELAGDWSGAARADEAAWRSFAAVGDTLRAGSSLRRLSRDRLQLGEVDSLSILSKAVALLEPHGPTPELAWAYADVARHHLRVTGDRAQASEWAGRAMALGKDISLLAVVADARITLGWAIDATESDHANGMQLVRQGLDEAVCAGDLEAASRGFNNLIGLLKLYATGDRRALFEEWRQFAARTGHRHLVFLMWSILFAISDGDFDTVIAEAAEAIPSTNEMSVRLQILAEIARTSREGPDSSSARVRELLHSLESRPARFRRNLEDAPVEWFLLAGDFERAVAEANAIRASAERPPDLALIVGALLAARAADDESARISWSDFALESSASSELRRFSARLLDADAAERGGQFLEAAEMLGQLAKALDAPVVRTLVQLRRIELLSSVNRGAARAELEEVFAFWEKAKATWYLGEVRRWASERGLRLREPGAPRLGTLLSEREREVARLVSEGLSNREIAERLIVSERTAEGHVQRIMSKLSFRSRSQIATWFTEQRLAPAQL